jgi:hypothetical protein
MAVCLIEIVLPEGQELFLKHYPESAVWRKLADDSKSWLAWIKHEATYRFTFCSRSVGFSALPCRLLPDGCQTGSGRGGCFFPIPFLLIAVLLLFPFEVTGWWIIAVMSILGLFMGVIPAATFADHGKPTVSRARDGRC